MVGYTTATAQLFELTIYGDTFPCSNRIANDTYGYRQKHKKTTFSTDKSRKLHSAQTISTQVSVTELLIFSLAFCGSGITVNYL